MPSHCATAADPWAEKGPFVHVHLVCLGRGSFGASVILFQCDGTGYFLPRLLIDNPLNGGVESQDLFVRRHEAGDELDQNIGVLVNVEERRHVDPTAIVMNEAEDLFGDQERASEMAIRLLDENLAMIQVSSRADYWRKK